MAAPIPDRVATGYDVDVYDVDLAETPTAVIAAAYLPARRRLNGGTGGRTERRR